MTTQPCLWHKSHIPQPPCCLLLLLSAQVSAVFQTLGWGQACPGRASPAGADLCSGNHHPKAQQHLVFSQEVMRALRDVQCLSERGWCFPNYRNGLPARTETELESISVSWGEFELFHGRAAAIPTEG